MSWYARPKVEHQEHDGVAVWRLVGDWTRDLPLDERRDARAALNSEPIAPTVLDLSDLAFLDSWGEETIGDVLLHFHEQHGSAAWVFDTSRSAFYEGIRRALHRRGFSAAAFPDRDAAVASVKSTV